MDATILYSDILIIPNLSPFGFIFFLTIQTQASDIKSKQAQKESKEIQLGLNFNSSTVNVFTWT